MRAYSTLEQICAWANELPGAYLDLPFGPDVYTYKVGGRIFIFIHISFEPLLFTLKCDPDDSIALRLEYPQIIPGYHLNKRHWISLKEGSGLPEGLVKSLITESYYLVVDKLPRVVRFKILKTTGS